jgi:hypothetical protein
VNADQHVLLPLHVAEHEREVPFAVHRRRVGDRAELGRRRFQRAFTQPLHNAFSAQPVANQIRNRDHLYAVALTELQ